MSPPRGYRQSRRDANHTDIANYAEDIGFSVISVHSVARALDLIVGFGGVTQMVEIKDPNQPPSKRELTEGEMSVFQNWKGRPPVIWTCKTDVDATRKLLLDEQRGR